MNTISLDRIVSVSLLSALRGLANANTSALALFTNDVPIPGSYGTYGIYFDAPGVAQDFGSGSETYALAQAVFAQNPNILTGGGFLVVIPLVQSNGAQPAVLLSSGPINLTQLSASDYKIRLTVDGGSAADLAIGSIDSSSIAAAQASLNSTAVQAADVEFVVSGVPTSAQIQLKTTSTGASSEIVVGTVTGGTDIAPLIGISGTVGGTAAGVEKYRDAILRTFNTVYYFGIIFSQIVPDADIPNIASLVQSIDKMAFFAETDSAKIAGILQTITDDGFKNSRGLFRSTSTAEALYYAAGYAGRGLSVNFDGQRTVSTMNLKEIIGIGADPGLTETLVNSCQTAGVDMYANFGIPKLLTSGANDWFDDVYTKLAFKLQIKVAGFNYLAQTNTKIPQTEEGMNGLKSAYREVCRKFVNNGAFAPGAWTSGTFGNPGDFYRNIGDYGFYIYSSPIAEQTESSRTNRIAPLVQIAAKSAGAIHHSDVTIFVEQ